MDQRARPIPAGGVSRLAVLGARVNAPSHAFAGQRSLVETAGRVRRTSQRVLDILDQRWWTCALQSTAAQQHDARHLQVRCKDDHGEFLGSALRDRLMPKEGQSPIALD